MTIHKPLRKGRLLLSALVLVLGPLATFAQSGSTQTTSINLNDLSAFRDPGKTWSIAGDVTADFKKDNTLKTGKGTGVLVNMPDKKNQGADLYTTFEHGDLDIELDYLMAKNSNSGIYLQGRYEVQLLDSWGKQNPKPGDNGGIYERWNDSKPEGQKGYEGYAPRQNVSRAPGLWQHLRISFQAPRFDASGRKTENAKMLRVELNGVTIHEDVELLGPTRGAMANDEKAMGPIRIQGDHGAVAFRNIKLTSFNKPHPELVNLKYQIYKGKFDREPDLSKLPPEAQGTSVIMSSTVSRIPNEFLIRYTGTVNVKETGQYTFNLNSSGGGSMLKINNQTVVPLGNGRGEVNLPAGNLPFELLYSKYVPWEKSALGLTVGGPGIRDYLVTDALASNNEPIDPIWVDAPTNTVLRSFMDIPGSPRVSHAVSVGSPDQVHYTYDLDKGAIVQIWRGGFLDATPMWHSRGDGSSRPRGAVQRFGTPVFAVAKLGSAQAAWATDTTGSGFRPQGYRLDERDQPTFMYRVFGSTVSDVIRVTDNGQGLRRELTVQNPAADLYTRITAGKTIEAMGDNMYVVDGQSYYLRLDETAGAKPVIRDANGQKELILPVRGKVSYSILF